MLPCESSSLLRDVAVSRPREGEASRERRFRGLPPSGLCGSRTCSPSDLAEVACGEVCRVVLLSAEVRVETPSLALGAGVEAHREAPDPPAVWRRLLLEALFEAWVLELRLLLDGLLCSRPSLESVGGLRFELDGLLDSLNVDWFEEERQEEELAAGVEVEDEAGAHLLCCVPPPALDNSACCSERRLDHLDCSAMLLFPT